MSPYFIFEKRLMATSEREREKERERERERERVREAQDCYHWHGTFRSHIVILYPEPCLFASFIGGYQSGADCHPRVVTDCSPNMTESAHIYVSTANLLSLYTIFNTNAFSFRLSVHGIHFRCPLVYSVVVSCLEIHNWHAVKCQYVIFWAAHTILPLIINEKWKKWEQKKINYFGWNKLDYIVKFTCVAELSPHNYS